MAILILFGAGASYGSEPNGAPKPPLGDKLFDELVKLNGVAASLPENIKNIFRDEDFETGMAALSIQHEDKVERFNREMCGYLAQFVSSDDSLYVSLLKKLSGRNVIYSSLNYDMMLETAAEKLGLDFKYDTDRLHGSIRIIKPHGSINFLPDFGTNNLNFTAIGCKVAIVAPVKPVSLEVCRAKTKSTGSFSPVISLYAKGKPVRVCPDFVKDQQDYFERACRRASKIFIVGVRLVEEDHHIWGVLKRSWADITYFGNSAEKANLLEWAATGTQTKLKYVEGYFDVAIEEISAHV